MNWRSRVLLVTAVVVAVSAVGCGGGRRLDTERSPQAGPPRAAKAAAAPQTEPWPHVEALFAIARRSGGNRAAGTRGADASVVLVGERLRAAGWRVSTQPVRFPFFRERRAPRVVAGGRVLRAGADVRTLVYSSGGRATGRLARIPDAGCRPDDWRGRSRDRVALVRRGVCPFATKVRRAQAGGATAVVVFDPAVRGDRGPVRGTLGAPGLRIPAVVVDGDAADRLVRAREEVGVRVDAVSERRQMHNVIAELPGRDPARVVMAGAHLDSVPEGPGMNDNASGVAALLAIAARMRSGGQRDTVRLGFWAAEELGLYGSRHYVETLGADGRQALRAYVNLDMVASPNPVLSVYGSGAPAAALRQALNAGGPAPARTSIGDGSDHAPFRRAGVPIAGVYTGGSDDKSVNEARRFGGTAGRPYDPCYHRACDALDNVDRPTLERVTDATERALRALAGSL